MPVDCYGNKCIQYECNNLHNTLEDHWISLTTAVVEWIIGLLSSSMKHRKDEG